MQESFDIFDFQIVLESEEFEKSPDYWQKQYFLLYKQLHKNVFEGSIEPLTCECKVGDKSGIDTLFNILVASGITLKAFDRMFDVTKVWLKYRNSAKVILKYEDGSTLEITDLPKSEAFELIKNHQQRLNE